MMSELDPPQLRSDRLGHRPRASRDHRCAGRSRVFHRRSRRIRRGEETITLVAGDGEKVAVTVHGGAILSSASDGTRIVTGGDDGNVVALDTKGESSVLVTDAKRRWIDNVAVHPDGTIAWSAGKTAFVRGLKGEDKSLEAPSSVGGLAFAPKGLRLALAHYNGVIAVVSEHDCDAGAAGMGRLAPRRYVQSRQQVSHHHHARAGAARLAAGRCAAHANDRLSQPRQIHVMGLGGKLLATSGADRVVVWPFASKDGPMDKEPVCWPSCRRASPRSLAIRRRTSRRRLRERHHPDGAARNGAKVVVRHDGDAPVAALAWNAKGSMLAFALQNGDAGLVDL